MAEAGTKAMKEITKTQTQQPDFGTSGSRAEIPAVFHAHRHFAV